MVECACVLRKKSRSVTGLVRRHPGIDDDRLAVQPELERQGVGVSMRRQERRRHRPAVERERKPTSPDEDVPGLGEDADAVRRRGELERRRDVEPAVVEEPRRAVGPRRCGGEFEHRTTALLDVGVRTHARQVAQDEAVIRGAALVVAAVGEDLLGQLAREQRFAAASNVGSPNATPPSTSATALRITWLPRTSSSTFAATRASARRAPSATTGASDGSSVAAAIQFAARVDAVYGCHASSARGG